MTLTFKGGYTVLIWKDVVGYEGIYEVSSSGLVRTKEGKTTFTQRHGIRKWKQRILKDKTPNGRDYRVALYKDGKPKYFLVHRLVAEAFLQKAEGKNCVNHKDGNPKNNNVSNLEWCDHTENNNHAFDNGLMSTNKKITLVNKKTGEKHEFRSMSKAGLFLGKSDKYISAILIKGKTSACGYEIVRR